MRNPSAQRWLVVTGAALLFACTGDRTTEPKPLIEPSGLATFALTETGNGPGACLQEDVDDANAIKTGFVPGEGTLNCTSNDVDISIATVSQYSFVSDAGPWTTLAPGEVISCTGGETVWVDTDALVENNAQERYDLGMWINPIDGGSALTGAECLQFNLLPGQNGSTSLEATNPDACGDVAAGQLLTIPLDVLTIECQDPDEDGFVEIGACAAWQNSEDGADRICPNATLFGSEGFRYGTLPENKSKCRCEPLLLPISVKGKIRIDKVTIPAGDPTSFTFTPTGFNGGSTFPLTDAAAPFESQPLDAGTYSVVETVPSGWTLGPRACVYTGTSDVADFSQTTNGVSIDLGPGDDVTCTFTNTATASIDVEKQTVGGTATFNYTTVGTGLVNFSRNTGTTNPTTTAPVSLTGVNVAGDKYITESALAGWTLTNIVCTANGATVEIGTGTGGGFNNNGSALYNAGDNTVKITLVAGSSPSCLFTNTKDGSLAIQKQTIGGTATFAFTGSGSGVPANFNRNTAINNPTTEAAFPILGSQLGDKYVTESALAGWTLTNIQCTANGATILIGTGTGGAFNQNASAGYDQGDNTVKVTMAAGATPTCTFVNTKSSGLSIQKQTIGGTATFAFTGSGTNVPANFNRNTAINNPTTEAQFDFDGTQLGDKYATETALAGWTLTNITCSADGATILIGTGQGGAFNQNASAGYDQGDNTVKVTVGAGQSPSCTFVNTKNASLDIEKQSIGGTETFDYTASGSGLPANFTRNTAVTNPTANAPYDFDGTQLGVKYVSESAEAGWDLTNISCTANGAVIEIGTGQGGAFNNNGGAGFNAGDNTVKVTVDAGDTPSCTFVNTKRGTIIIRKETDPDAAPGSFGFTRSFGGAFSLVDGGSSTFNNVLPGPHTVTEDDPTPLFDLYQITCTEGTSNTTTSVPLRRASINLDPGETVDCTFYNRQRATVTVNKLEGGGLPLTRAWEFQIRKNASPASSGTVVAAGTAVLATGLVEFSCTPNPNADCANSGGIAHFVPGSYQFCEINMPAGWANNISGFTPDGENAEGADNGNECVNITLGAGASGMPSGITTGNVAIDNSPPPGGDARTIGYWKTHSCEAPGNQEDALTPLLPILLTSDGGAPPSGWLLNSCEDAVTLLDKRDLGNNKKSANDAAYGLAAQLIAALLNEEAGAGTCAAAESAKQAAQELLYDIGFDGSGVFLTSKVGDQAVRNDALSLAATLDSYNNNLLCP